MRSFVVLAISIIACASAEKFYCPSGSAGEYPHCICADEFPYDQVNNICSTEINVFQVCPKGLEGDFPNCACKDGLVFVPKTGECTLVDRSICPLGSTKVNNKCVCEHKHGFKYEFDEIFHVCRPWYIPTSPPPTAPPCPTHQHRVGDKCEWDHCPAGYTSKTGYWPDCVPPVTCHTKGLIGEYPNCYAAPVTCGYHQTGKYPDCHWLPCPASYQSKTGYWPDCVAPPSCSDRGLIGIYPDCHPLPPTCPPLHHRNSNGECVRIPCPPGHEGDFQPNCKLVPKCPPEYPGKWPNCNIYATTPRNTYIPPETPRPRTTTTTTTTRRPIITTTTTTTRRPTPPKPAKCFCQCSSNEIVVFRDNFEWNPSLKYKRSANEEQEN